VFAVFSPKDMAAFREFLSRFIEAFERGASARNARSD
jgi:hypothetical protein